MSSLPVVPGSAELFHDRLKQRQARGRLFRWFCLGATVFGVVALALLLLDVIGSTFTWSAVQDRELRGENVPQVQQSWSLWEGLYNRGEINQIIEERHPEARLVFYSWINPDFFLNFPSRFPEISGFRSPLLGSMFVILLTAVMAFPLGVGAAIYMEEYGGRGWISRIIETNIANLAGVPSIIYGLLGLAIFVRSWGSLTGGRTVIAGALTMTLVSLPVIIVAAREAIRAVPPSLREASYALGGSKWDTVSAHILPAAMPGILTGMILSMSRAIGETAPLITIGALTYIAFDPGGVRDVFTVMPIQIFTWVSLPQAAFHHLASAGILILLTILLSMNAVAIIIRRKTERTW